MSNFSAVQSLCIEDIDKTDQTANVQQAIKDAVKFYNNREAMWFQEERAQTTVFTSSDLYQLPSDFDSRETLTILDPTNSDTWALTPKPLEWILERTDTDHTSHPKFYTIFDDQIQLYPYPDQTYTLSLYYKRNLSEVTATPAYTSSWFTEADDLIRYRADRMIYKNILHDTEASNEAKEMEAEQYNTLLKRHRRRLQTGRSVKWF
jgi:hypothetical protein